MMRRVKLAVPILVLTLALPTVATAGEQVRDERRLFSDGTPQEVWTYDGAIAPDKLVLKELVKQLAQVTDHAEHVGDRLMIVSVKRRV